ncbi:hypothetical protein [Sinorhizobium meliloti]|uniref:hypothetical protein n=1 Tax=Rhizobium meliloti TaxID=382 RepID=UPI0013E3FCC3|nr:hypothetical protein [Sinorhizobium meliloti]
MSIKIACRCGEHRMDFTAYLLMPASARNAFRSEIETCRGCDDVETAKVAQPVEARP